MFFEWKTDRQAFWCRLCGQWADDRHVAARKHSHREQWPDTYLQEELAPCPPRTIGTPDPCGVGPRPPPPPPPPPPLPPLPPVFSSACAAASGTAVLWRAALGVDMPPPPLPLRPEASGAQTLWGAAPGAEEPPPPPPPPLLPPVDLAALPPPFPAVPPSDRAPSRPAGPASDQIPRIAISDVPLAIDPEPPQPPQPTLHLRDGLAPAHQNLQQSSISVITLPVGQPDQQWTLLFSHEYQRSFWYCEDTGEAAWEVSSVLVAEDFRAA